MERGLELFGPVPNPPVLSELPVREFPFSYFWVAYKSTRYLNSKEYRKRLNPASLSPIACESYTSHRSSLRTAKHTSALLNFEEDEEGQTEEL